MRLLAAIALTGPLSLAACDTEKTIYRVPTPIPGLGWDLGADGGGDETDGGDGGEDTGDWDCDRAGTWATVGQPLSLTWCAGCHGGQAVDRHGAPEDVVLDTRAGFVAHGERSVLRMQAGTMPPGGGLSEVELRQVERWLACGAPGEEAALTGDAEAWGPTTGSRVRVEVFDVGGGEVLVDHRPAERFGEATYGRVLTEEVLLSGEDAWLLSWTWTAPGGTLIQAEAYEPPLPLTADAESWSAETTVTIDTLDGTTTTERRWSLERVAAPSVDGRAPDPSPIHLVALGDDGVELGWALSGPYGVVARWSFDADGAGFVEQQSLDQSEGAWPGFPLAPGDDVRAVFVTYGGAAMSCSGPVFSRRGVLLGGAGAALGLALPRLARASGDRLLLVFWVPGGWDPTYVFDPHFDDPGVARDSTSEPGTVGGLTFADSARRPAVREFLSRYADQTVLINGLAVGSISHTQCARLVLTGSRQPDAADFGTRVAAHATRPYALPHLVVSGPRYPGTLGAHTVPLNPLLTGTVRGELPRRGGAFDPDREARIRAYLAEEAATLPDSAPAAAYAEGLARLDELEDRVEDVHVMEFATDDELLDAGVGALASGLSRVVTVGGTLPFMSQWDSHTNNDFYQNQNYEHLFDELSRLMTRLAGLPDPAGGGSLLDVTTIAVMSEMGRTPALNGTEGKDHWPYTSLMLLGAGIAGGRVLGATNEALVGQPLDPTSGAPSSSGSVLSPASLAAGLLSHLDVDPAEAFPGVTPFSAPFG